MTESSVQQIQQRLTCPICLERYKSPKLLPCQHTFCLSPCLSNLADRNVRSLKCPECRSIHNIPIDGVKAFPNNITILRFLDLNLTKSSFLRSITVDNCFQCKQKVDNIGKCLDCEKLFCESCRPLHLSQLKNETKSAILKLRKILPILSLKVGNYEQKKEKLTQNYSSIKREITNVIEKLIEDLKTREKCLHAEADVYLQTKLRTVEIEKENAEIELTSITSFCDNTEIALNRSDNETLDNEIALVKKQSSNFIEYTKNIDENIMQINKINLRITDLNDLSNYISNFGNLTIQNETNNQNLIINLNEYDNNANQPRIRPTWQVDRSIDRLNLFSSRTNDNESITDRQTLTPLPRPTGFNIAFSNNRRLETLTNNNSNNNTLERSNTFTLDDTTNEQNENVNFSARTRRLELNELNNNSRVRRTRARTPLTFNVMLNEPNQNIQFDFNDSSVVYSNLNAPMVPAINYSEKTRAKLIFGKKGKNDGDLVWPCDVSINNFNKQILVSDSGNNRVQIFDSSGRFIKKFGMQGRELGQFDSLSGIYIDSMANIYSTDRLNHRYLRPVRSIGGGPGNAPGKLNFPLGICVNRISERICVFHSSGKFIRTFGRFGTANGEFDKPNFIHITRENLILVSDSSNHRVQVFDSNGIFQHTFGREGSNQAEFKYPRGIAQDREGFILVADSGNSRIQIFRPTDYMWCGEFGSAGTENGQFMGIEGIQVAHNGDIIICDRENHRIQIF